MVKERILSPFQKFVKIESFSGILLFGATLLALILANSGIRDYFQSIWDFKLGIQAQNFELVKPLLLWINDGLMAVFFFLIGLEIKRELLIGELNTIRKASFPLFAAIGGMLFPVLLFLALNRNPDASHAWGVPMATDIAFSLAILRLLGKNIPIGLKVFLTAFAIVDDLGAVMIIALFYSSSLKWGLIGIAVLILAVLFILSYRQVYAKYFLIISGLVVWFLFLKAGIHPTIAGVLLALAVPIRRKVDTFTYISNLQNIVSSICKYENQSTPLLTNDQIIEIDNLEDWTEKVQSPLQHLEHKLHNWVAFLIMPVFALSNAGVAFDPSQPMDTSLSLVIIISLVFGKFIGISLLSWIAIKTKLADLPKGVNLQQIIGVSLLAGVGFTMSVFVANLAFEDSMYLLDSAKLGIIVGSLLAGLSGFLVLKFNRAKKEEQND